MSANTSTLAGNSLALRLSQTRQAVVQLWENHVYNVTPEDGARDPLLRQLCDAFLAQLAAALMQPTPQNSDQLHASARAVGAQRVKATTAALAALLAEQRFVRDLLLRLVYPSGMYPADGAAVVLDALDVVFRQAITTATTPDGGRALRTIQTELRRSKEHLSLALEAGRFGTWSVDLPSGQPTISAAAAALFGMDDPDNAWPAIDSMIHQDDRQHFQQVWETALKNRQPALVEYRVHRPDGVTVWLESRGAIRCDASGEPICILGVVCDVTERHQTEDRLRQSIVEMQQQRKMDELFVACLSHDLRTPLTAARLAAQRLGRHAHDAAVVSKTAHVIEGRIDRSDEMIRDLLDVYRLKAGGRVPIEPTLCDLRQVVEETIDEMRAIHGNRFDVHGAEPIAGFFCRRGVRRIVENLCNNAIKYGDAQRPVSIMLRNDRDAASVAVHNDGPPIPPDAQARLFEPFQRSSAAQASSKVGWGLGLSLVRGISESHGGNVQVHSSACEGTVFTVNFPANQGRFATAAATANVTDR